MSSENTHRQQARRLLNHLAPAQVEAVLHLMEVMLDPVSLKLANAPAGGKEISEEEELGGVGVFGMAETPCAYIQ